MVLLEKQSVRALLPAVGESQPLPRGSKSRPAAVLECSQLRCLPSPPLKLLASDGAVLPGRLRGGEGRDQGIKTHHIMSRQSSHFWSHSPGLSFLEVVTL